MPLYFKTRLKQPDTGYKWIRAISPKADGTGWQVAKVLKESGWLDCDIDKNTKAMRLPDSAKTVRVYAFNSAMWQWDGEAIADIAKK